ncbi:DUF4625 domain-containing protein [Fulvivirga sediminis]|uniref:DUF4625 domain-containing protein n=1 Tax=Fulvivirga sediminis TaxID=2803949 RepID=A0A937K0R4_9BACT|nr:DUF4625 domain-containing protein [Fulvivirga sediminis]MBL3658613.1 DUF4625 domain-containing protein [Fulvivirga sediminis]
MKNKQLLLRARLFLVALVCFSTFMACSDDDDDTPSLPAPTITDFEYGKGSSHSTGQVGYKGSNLHTEAKIVAEASVKSITLTIHGHDLKIADGEVEWDFEKVFTDEKYLVKNPTFHEHIAIPANIPSGEYHITLLVTDQAGKTTESEGHLEIMEGETDTEEISYSDISIDETVVRGKDLHTEFFIDAHHGIHHIIVNIHGHDLTVGEGEEEWHFEQEFEEGYHGETEVEFHEHIDVPATAPVGEYHATFIIEDEEGHKLEFESHIEVAAAS